MDAGEYDTNALLINNVSSIAFKVYEPISPQASVSGVENTLRNSGHLVYGDSSRRIVWCFYLTGKDGSRLGQSGEPILTAELNVCGCKLLLVEEGTFEPTNLLKSRPPGASSINTPSSSSSSNSALETTARSGQPFGAPPPLPTANSAVDGDSKTGVLVPSDAKSYSATPVKGMYEYFISSVLSSLASLFSARTGAIPLNSRSLLLPASSTQDADQARSTAKILTFRIYVTTAGSLVVSLRLATTKALLSSADSLRSNLLSPGTVVFAAPLGVFGTFQGITGGEYPSLDGSAVPSPDTQITRFRPESNEKAAQWRSMCSRLLEVRGIPSAIISNSSWLSLQSLRRKPLEQKSDGKRTPVISTSSSILWPSALCFRKVPRKGQSTYSITEGVWAGVNETFDPLDSAKMWYLGNGEREETLAKRKKEREAAPSRDGAENENRSQHPNGYSPLALRRASNSGAAVGAMYPTPPDGVQNPVGVTPSFDGNVSSPGNQNNTAAIADPDINMTTTGGSGEVFADGWDGNDTNEGNESKREQGNGQFLIQGENLFGDIGEDMFGDNDITDADFNFFDEEPGSMDVTLSGMPDIDTTSGPPANAGHELDDFTQKNVGVEDIKMDDVPASPVFAKPELKHARSSLIDDNRQENIPPRPSSGIKRQPSPFNPDTVYKRVKASLGAFNTNKSVAVKAPPRRGSIFDKVDFDPSLSLFNSKYQDSGRFDCHWDAEKESKHHPEPTEPPTTQYFRRHGKGRGKLKDLPSNMGALIARITGDLESSSLHHSPGRLDEVTSDADEVSLVSDQDDSSDFSDEPSSPTKSSVVRRRRFEDDRESLATSLKDMEALEDSPGQSSVDLSKITNNESSEISIPEYFAEPEPTLQHVSFSDDDFMTIAQILTEQVVSGRLNISGLNSDTEISGKMESRRELATGIRNSLQVLQSILPPALTDAVECQFRPFIEVQDVPLIGQPSRMQPRPPGGVEQTRPAMFQIPAPHVELRRHETKLSVLPSAVGFWESLGLGPSQGTKDVHAICAFPAWDGLSDNASIFLDRLRSVYESMKLGNFDRLPSSANISNGLVPYEADQTTASPSSSTSRFGSALIDQMAKLAHTLINLSVAAKNFVVYFVYIPDSPASILESCAAFQRLFEMYKRALAEKKKAVQNELTLQLVPVDYLATATSMAIPPPAEHVRLCLETYDRCTLFGGPMPSPSIVLEQPLPRIIDFKLTTSPSANLLQENSCIHIAYAQSVDERWVTAAWTDNCGSKQMTASYCLGRKGKALSTPLADVAHEIWETTHDLISMWKVHWRIVITKCGPMDQQEIDFWIALGQTESKASISLTLVTVDTNPSLQLIPPTVKLPATASSVFYTTPVSTPQASIVSPEQSGNPPTPMGGAAATSATTPGGDNNATEADAEATLVDITDTTWGAVVSHRLNNSSSLVELNPALASGYLVKRGGPRTEDPPVAMEVNIVHSEGNPRVYELLLREMLTYFRGLGTLARARSVVDRETDVRPWHVAAAEKGVHALYHLM